VSSAVLFRGFKGTATEIITIVMGFLQICTGVVLLQLSKSAKDVPDTAVLKGDLDQMRTVAEQEDPESEPKADAIRGAAGIIRSFSKARRHREADEAKRVFTERMEPIGENEHVEWDGLRRRKTITEPGGSGITRRKSIHPPLGLTKFPDDVLLNELHPSDHSQHRNGSISSNTTSSTMPHVFGLPAGLRPTVVPVPRGLSELTHENTEYKPPTRPTIHFTSSALEQSQNDGPSVYDRNGDVTSLPPPRANFGQTTAKRQFSFTNVFGRGGRRDDGEERKVSSSSSAASLFGRKVKGSTHNTVTEEEQLGLVKGDSNMPGRSMLSKEAEADMYESPVEEEEEERETLNVGRQRGRGYADVMPEGDDSDDYDDRHDDFGFEKARNGRFDRGGAGGGAAFV